MTVEVRYATKVCKLCGVEKPRSEYHRHPQTKDRLQVRCKECAKSVANAAYRADPAHGKARVARWRAANPEKARRYQHNNRLKTHHGLTLEDYERMLAAQGGVCAICGTAEPGRRLMFFCMDHDHATGLVRGLLCDLCNVGLARFADDVRVLGRAIAYLGGPE